MKIIPSVMAKTQKEMNALFRKYTGVKELHLDIADGKFVSSKSLWFPFRLKSKFKYNAHLMVNDPLSWVKKNGKRVNLCIASFESVDVEEYIAYCKANKMKVGFALKPETKVKSLVKWIKDIDAVLVLCVHPGFYGAKFLRGPLCKIKQIRDLNPRIKIYVDGGMKPSTVKYVKGADYAISGSYLAKSDDFKKALKELKSAL
tara:strand:+ start:19571 stop:20176 length:606 start_codon:yes stop_codon:yes gene_type:complete